MTATARTLIGVALALAALAGIAAAASAVPPDQARFNQCVHTLQNTDLWTTRAVDVPACRDLPADQLHDAIILAAQP